MRTAVVVVVCGVALGVGILRAFSSDPIGASAAVPSGDVRAALSSRPGLRVLFVGNSLTYVNDLPGMFTRLSDSAVTRRKPVFSVSWAPGGSTLAQDEKTPRFWRLLSAVHWDVVVLQEGTQLAGVFSRQPTEMSADVAALASRLRSRGVLALLFETWGNRDGTDVASYAYEQAVLASNYATVGARYALPVAPAGNAWAASLRHDPAQTLWQADGHHPTVAGSYLAASVIQLCVNQLLAGQDRAAEAVSPSSIAGLSLAQARRLRTVAWSTVRQTECRPTAL